MRLTRALISEAALRHNLDGIRRSVGSGVRVMGVVKANAYGVGAVAVSKALEAVDPWGYGVATIEEGAELRAAGITRDASSASAAGAAGRGTTPSADWSRPDRSYS